MKTIIQKPELRTFYKGSHKWLVPNTLFLTLSGSHAYGTNIETSDVDVKGFCVAPREHYIGLPVTKPFEQAEFKDPDGVVYELRKFFKLATECNPNIIETLHTDESDWCGVTPLGRKIIDHRDLFVSKNAMYTFGGYAKGQLHRINNHYRWLKNPPTAAPTREEFGLPTRPVMNQEQMGAALTSIKKKIESWDINWDLLEPAERIIMQDRLASMLAEVNTSLENRWISAGKTLGYDDNFIHMLQMEQGYNQKLADWNSYLTWKEERNPQRAELEKKFGFDTKHAAHLVRLQRMRREILTTGKVIVKRPDAEELLAIRYGAWTYEQLIEWADKEDKEAVELYRNCKLIPAQADRNKISDLCSEIIAELLGFSL